jgi:glycosyltransferase involved in cell wall biosynthesis
VCIPSVSIIIPAYNGAALIARCLESVLAQAGRFLLEVIVVDDGSTDDTASVVENLRQDRLRLLRQENRGPAAARNAGLAQATSRYTAFLDADDYWEPRFLQETVGFLETHPEAIAVSVGQVHKVLGKPDWVVPHALQSESPWRGPQMLDSFFPFWARYAHVCTGSVLIRTDIAQRTGGQRTEFRICEDLEFWAYLATFGAWGFIPEVLFVSDGGAVTRRQGWLRKNRRRWASAPSVETWQQRIVGRLDPRERAGFQAVRARVAKNLAYAMILSGRDALARQTCSYFEGHATDRVGTLLTRAARSGATWKGLCAALRLREWWRDKRI